MYRFKGLVIKFLTVSACNRTLAGDESGYHSHTEEQRPSFGMGLRGQ
ncbi:hypothetical protein [Methanospirillum lacunae]|nr:hypothetical protein [Methanospirillum lacunae]